VNFYGSLFYSYYYSAVVDAIEETTIAQEPLMMQASTMDVVASF